MVQRRCIGVNAEDSKKSTPLHAFSQSVGELVDISNGGRLIIETVAICELLVKNGANIKAENDDGDTPLDLINRHISIYGEGSFGEDDGGQKEAITFMTLVKINESMLKYGTNINEI